MLKNSKNHLCYFKYLLLNTSKGRMEQEIDRQIAPLVCSDADSVPVCCGKETVKPKGKALCVPVDLCPYHHLWSTMGNDQKSDIMDTSQFPTQGGWTLPQRQGEKLSHSGGLRVKSLLFHIERSQLRWFRHLVMMSPGRLLWEVYMSNWAEAQDKSPQRDG